MQTAAVSTRTSATRNSSPLLIAVGLVPAVLATLLCGAPPACAQSVTPIVMTLASPNQTLIAPSTGDTTVNFYGTVTFGTGYYQVGSFIYGLTSASHSQLADKIVFTGDSRLNGGGSYTGLLFTVDVPAGAKADYYGYKSDLSGPCTYGIDVQNANNGPLLSDPQSFSVTVAPEPSQSSVLILGAFGLGGVACRAGKRRARR